MFVAASIVALVAMLKVHLPNGFTGQGGYEFVLTLFAGCMSMVLSGGGAFSLDKMLYRHKKGED